MGLAVKIGAEGASVLLEINGRGHVMSWQDAKRLWQALRIKTAQAEEYGDAQRLIDEQAILVRTPLNGVVGLTNNSEIRAEAWKASQWDSTYRKMKGKKGFTEPNEMAFPPRLWAAKRDG